MSNGAFDRTQRVPAGWARRSYNGVYVPERIAEAMLDDLAAESDVDTSGAATSEEGRSSEALPHDHDGEVPRVSVINQQEVEDFASRGMTRLNSEQKEQAQAWLKDLRRDAGYRALLTVPSAWPELLDELARDFENCQALVDYLRGVFALAQFTNGVARPSPMLLDGPPGIGKTYIVESIASMLQVALVRISLASAQDPAALSGTSRFWENTGPGRLFDALVRGRTASPVVLLDECDKAAGSRRYPPLSPLYDLLDRNQACHWSDLAYPSLTLDASHPWWFLTSNEAELIPEPLLNRVRTFEIAPPTAEQKMRLARRIFDAIRKSFADVVAIEPLSDEVAETLITVSPRQMHRLLNDALGQAIYAGRRHVVADDLDMPASRAGIGFVAQ